VHIQEVWICDFVDKKDSHNSYRQMLITREIRFPDVDTPLKFTKLDLSADLELALTKAWSRAYQKFQNNFDKDVKVASVKAIKMIASRLRSSIKNNVKQIRSHKKFHHEEREVLPDYPDLPTQSRGFKAAQRAKASNEQVARAQVLARPAPAPTALLASRQLPSFAALV